jgi:hypothetical protein
MKFTWHIIRKDLLRDRPALLVWALLFVAQVGMGFALLHVEPPDRDTMPFVQLASAVLVFLQFVMGYILVTRLVHADAVVGTNMFWCTRPVSAARLLVAKALGALLIFGLLPVLLLLPWWLYCGFGAREIVWTAIEMFGWQLLMIAPAFLVASLTDDLGRVLLWTLLLLIGLLSWVVLLQASLTAITGKAFAFMGGTDAVYTRVCVAAVILIVGSAVIAAHQYLTRRFVRSVVLAAVALGLIALVGQFFPWNWTPGIRNLSEPALPSAPAELMERITFEALPASGLLNHPAGEKREGPALDTMLHLWLRVQGVPDGLYVGVGKTTHAWTWPNGIHLTRQGNYYGGFDFDHATLRRLFSLPVPLEDPETVAWTKLKRDEMDARLKARGLPGLRRRSAEERQGRVFYSSATVPNSFAQKMRNEPPAYTASLEGVLYRLEVMTELPLAPGANAAGEAMTLQFLQMRDGKPLVLTTQAALPRSGLWNSGGVSGSGANDWRTPVQAIAVNTFTGDIDWVGNNQSGSQYLVVAGVVLNWNIMHLFSRHVIRDGKSVGLGALDPQWRDHTKLVFLTPVNVVRFNREVTAEKYTLRDDAENNDVIDAKAGGKP